MKVKQMRFVQQSAQVDLLLAQIIFCQKKNSVQRIGTVNKGANGFVTEGQQFLKSVCPYHSCCVPIKVQIDQEKYIVTRENRLNRFNTRWRDFL